MNWYRLATVVAALASLPSAHAETPADRWNLSDLYASPAAFDADVGKVEAQLKEFNACAGHLGDSVGRFKACLDLQSDLTKRFARLDIFASEQLAQDTGAAPSLELTQRLEVLGAKLGESSAFLSPEVLQLGSNRIAQMLKADPSLSIYRHPLDEILRKAPHTLDAEGESLVARFGLMSGASAGTYSILSNADLPRPTVVLSTGESVKLDATGYTRYRGVDNAEDRKRVMDAFFGGLKSYERTFGTTLYGQLKEDSVYAQVRKYPDSISRALDEHRLPVAVLDTLIAQTNANLPTLHRYFRLRAKMLGIEKLRYSDIYPPLVKSSIKFPLEKAKQLVVEAVAPLGPDYVATMKSGFESRWMDAYPRPNKQSGAHMAGEAYDVHPYVLVNYNEDYESVSTVAHEWGHAMHSYLANHAQPFVTADYPIFIAEIASTFDEALLLQHMLKTAKSDDERLLYLGSALEELRGTFFRQAMFAEFERTVHAQADQGSPLSGEALTKTYCDILNRYHGTKEGVMSIEPAYCIEWAYIPHFYREFYVYQYATSIAASSLFAEKVGKGEPGALKRYVDLLKAGGSDYPYELVKAAGADLASPAPYQALVARMNSIMDEIEQILAKKR